MFLTTLSKSISFDVVAVDMGITYIFLMQNN